MWQHVAVEQLELLRKSTGACSDSSVCCAACRRMMSAGAVRRPRASSQNGYDTTWHYASPYCNGYSASAVVRRIPASQKRTGMTRPGTMPTSTMPAGTMPASLQTLYVEIVEICQREDEALQRE
jgi:hypothetical protein